MSGEKGVRFSTVVQTPVGGSFRAGGPYLEQRAPLSIPKPSAAESLVEPFL
jgi:hypothetical protein